MLQMSRDINSKTIGKKEGVTAASEVRRIIG